MRPRAAISEAETLIGRALAASKRVLGHDHPLHASQREQSGSTVSGPGPLREAEPLHKRALAACERVMGQQHPDTLTSVNNLAALYQAQGRYEQAGAALYTRAPRPASGCWLKEHPSTIQKPEQSGGAVSRPKASYGEAEAL